MEARGHQFLITARDRKYVKELLEAYHIPYVNRGRGGNTLVGKFFYLIKTCWKQYLRARVFRPDIFFDFSTVYSGPASWLLKKPYLTFTDTENTGLYRRLINPFCEAVYTPACFRGDLGPSHVRFNGLMEMASLVGFDPDPSVLDRLGLEKGERYAVIRFVDWKALHDRGKRGFSDHHKLELVQELSTLGRVFISSEGGLPKSLRPYQLELPACQIYQVLHYASLFVGESATMASEAALLGTPSLFVSDCKLGYLQYLEQQNNMVRCFGSSQKDQKEAIALGRRLMASLDAKEAVGIKAHRFVNRHIDVVDFMVREVEAWGVKSVNKGE